MRSLLNPKWLFVINSLPIVLLFFLYYSQFNIIKSLLEEKNIELWKSFSIALATLGLANFGYAIYLQVKKLKVPIFYSVIALLGYTFFIYQYGMHFDELMPRSIPRWMMPGNLFLYAGTFLMPTLAYALFVLVIHCTPETNKKYQSLKNFSAAMLIPVSGYIFSQLILPFWKIPDKYFDIHAILVFLVVAILLFFFFLVRSIFIFINKKSGLFYTYQLLWKIPIAIILPVIGLLVNNGHFFADGFGSNGYGLFGDFNNIWFYLIAVLNGVLLCLPNIENKIYRVFLFLGRSITLTYTFYFFIVFLPFLPLSLFAVVLAGSGFLMLTPLILMLVHVNELSKDFTWIKNYYSTTLVLVLSFVAVLFIPTIITFNYINARKNLLSSLSYLYQPNYSKKYNINKASLQKTIKMVKNHKLGDRDFITGSQLPYLTHYFNWLVLDNLTLSDKKISTIERVFFNKKSIKLRPEISNPKDDVQITNIKTTTDYDATQNAWRTWIDLEITNNENRNLQEYTTTFELPEGSWISDHYLYIGDRKEKGILSEKKTAMWIYSNITRQRRDPSILHYLNGNKVAFRVFPFAANEVRKTGIEILHKTPIELTIDKQKIKLGEENEEDNHLNDVFENEHFAYIPANKKKQLEQVYRKPYFSFIVDCSKKENIPDFTQRIEKLIKQYPNLAENAIISFTNSYVTTHPFNADWKQQLQNQNFEGGFYIDRAIKSVLYDAYLKNTENYPVIVTVTDDVDSAIFEKDFSDWKFAFPESDAYFNLKNNGTLDEHTLTANPKQVVKEQVSILLKQQVLKYQFNDETTAYVANNNKANLIVKLNAAEVEEQTYLLKNWESAAAMQANYTMHLLHPENKNKAWLNLVKQSFQTQIMSPVTSFIALENEAQKAMLKKKQAQVLASNPSLDLGDEVQQMSEPGLLLLSILMLLFIFTINRRKLKRETNKICIIKQRNYSEVRPFYC